MYERTKQIMNHSKILLDIVRDHRHALARLSRAYKYDLARTITTAYFSTTNIRYAVSYANIVHNFDDRNFLENGYCMFMFDGRQRRRSVIMLRDHESKSPFTHDIYLR